MINAEKLKQRSLKENLNHVVDKHQRPRRTYLTGKFVCLGVLIIADGTTAKRAYNAEFDALCAQAS